MRAFAKLVEVLAGSTKTNDKLDALQAYFENAPDAGRVWVIALFSGRRPKAFVKTSFLRLWCMEESGIPAWLFEESYHTVGDLAETISLLLPENADNVAQKETDLSSYFESFLSLSKASDEEKRNYVLQNWKQMTKTEIFVFNKLITGGFRIGVSQK